MNSSLVYLVQTDTTVGFSSSNDEKLSSIKQRIKSKKILQTLDSFLTLQNNIRVPKKFRKKVRNLKKTTCIYPSLQSFRVIDQESNYHIFIKKFNALYSTSANLSGNNFDFDFANSNSDIIVFSKDKFKETSSSSIYKINKKKIIKIR